MNQAPPVGVVPNQITSPSIKEHPLALICSVPESPKQHTEIAGLNFPKDEKFSHGEAEGNSFNKEQGLVQFAFSN